jgi:SAM-dependent methyltransferase
MTTLASLLGRAARYLRSRRAGWNADTDRRFHDEIFASQHHDPFDLAYPGRITIRRFADLASVHVKNETTVFDLGCGPGEITCELASRFPAVAFHGRDHSAAAIERARQLAAIRELTNVSFERADVNQARVDEAAGLVTMFDAFHHMVAPEAFVARNAHVPRWFLIEPAGDALGRWQYRQDLDWVLLELDKLRGRLEHELGVAAAATSPAGLSAGDTNDADAVEFRYSLDEYERMFAGYGVHAVGTTAGLTEYPRLVTAPTDIRRMFYDFAYAVLAEADARLLSTNDDLDARHWAIYCARGKHFPRRRPRGGGAMPPGTPLRGPYGAAYELMRGHEELAPGATANFVVRVTNTGFLDWTSAGDATFNASYHWRDGRGRAVLAEGRRTPLVAPVPSGQSIATNVVVQAPAAPGRYTLEIELVHEGVTWLSEAGQPVLAVSIRVR